jgi:CRP-like cAMP-binding protein
MRDPTGRYRWNSMHSSDNQLIERLPRRVQQRLLTRCEPFELVPSTALCACGGTLTHAYFPITGRIALQHGPDASEVGVVGRESMLGAELLLGVTSSPWRAVVQAGGTCWRIEAQALRQAMADLHTLQALLQRNLMVRVHQQQALAAAIGGPWALPITHPGHPVAGAESPPAYASAQTPAGPFH